MNQDADKWLRDFTNNFPLPAPQDDSLQPSGWTMEIKELQDFTLSKELKSRPDTSSFGIKIYVSVFSPKDRLFHGRTWTSPLITDITTRYINLTTYGILLGKDLLLVIEFAFCIQNFSSETEETSLFFTVVPSPSAAIEHICPLYFGSPRYLLSMPENFTSGLTTRQGQLLLKFSKNDDLLKAIDFIPACTFFHRVFPGITKLSPFQVEMFSPITINGIKLETEPDFEIKLQDELSVMFSTKYQMPPQKFQVRIVKKAVHLLCHNTHRAVTDVMKAEVTGDKVWSFDGQIIIKNYVKKPQFALLIQLVVTAEVDISVLKQVHFTPSTEQKPDKALVDLPLGFAIYIPTTDASVVVSFCTEARLSPFNTRIVKIKLPVPSIQFNVSFSQIVGKEQTSEAQALAIEFRPLIGPDGGALLPLDMQNIPEVPDINEEITDVLNVNHLLFLFKYIVMKPSFQQRYPISMFKHLFICIDIWPFGFVRSSNCTLEHVQQDSYSFNEDLPKGNNRGTLIKVDISLKNVDHVINYMMQMRSNELQAIIIDCESGVQLGYINLPTETMIRQKRVSLQFTSHANFMAHDGELLGTVYFSCGSYGTTDHAIANSPFEFKFQNNNDLIISKPLITYDNQFREIVQKTNESAYQVAVRYRDGKKKQLILSDLQKRFLRTKIIYPIPGLETRFVFISAYEPTEKITITISSQDERVRLIRRLDSEEATNYDKIFHISRDEKSSFIQAADRPVEDRFNLIKHGGKIDVEPEKEICLEFGFFSVQPFSDVEIFVSLFDENNELLDLFSVQVRNTVPVVHENVQLPLADGGAVLHTLSTMNNVSSAIASTGLIYVEATTFGIRISSAPINNSMRCLIFMFGSDDSLLKIVRLNILILGDEVLQIGTKLKINVSRWIGSRICCKTDDARVAKFITYTDPSVLREPGEVTVRAYNSGSTQLSVWSLTDMSLCASILLRVGESKMESGAQVCLGKTEITIKVGDSIKRAVHYKNSTNHQKTVRVTTSKPNLVSFDPTHYTVGPQETVKIRMIFLVNTKPEDVVICAYVIESGTTKRTTEYFKFNVHYVNK